ncbi:helix-turn-helix transcriptional regulator [Flammeovirga agarivorans]|uniref:WYL domain-containing protein n=1 Tax=Flammeovirga agarivorans TaxID=2726742 RepID=A0A7X8SPK5_9BACT|nr:WYL domain-containing protein [Flammeovirga agarivorans]NLR94048.1 WYL domain-containing protein [Flammeovirga agarivorans]
MIQELSKYEYTVKELINKYEIKRSQIYNDFDTIKELLGPECFNKTTILGTRTFTYKLKPYYSIDIGNALTKKEQETILSLAYSSTSHEYRKHYDNIKRKIKSLTESNWAHVNSIIDKEFKVTNAITFGYRIKLIDYESPSSNKVKDYHLEPTALYDYNRRLHAYDLNSNKFKDFKITRAKAILITKEKCSLKDGYKPKFFDCFGFSCIKENEIQIQFEMTRLSANILKESYPDAIRSINHTQHEDFPYIFKGHIADYIGVGQFILSMPGKVRNIQPPTLIEHLITEKNKFLF